MSDATTTPNPAQPYRYFTLMAMIYLACELASLVLSYKIVHVSFFYGSAASFIFPITYTWNDVLTEVYGFNQAKKIIWAVFGCDAVFVLLTFFISQVPSVDATQQAQYYTILSPLWRALSAEMCGVLVGAFINAMMISKWKLIVKGRWFWLRSICSSAVGEMIMLLISVPIAMLGVLSLPDMFKFLLCAYAYKLIFASMVAWPANALVGLLKLREELDVYDFDISYNPFL